MNKSSKWISFKSLMETMDVSDENELRRIIHTENLQHYIDYTDYKTEPLTLNIVLVTDQMVERDVSPDKFVFKREDVERLKNERPHLLPMGSTKLKAKEAREFGQLKLEKKKWDNSISAAVQAGLFCKDQKTPITRKQLWNELTSKNLADIPDTTIDKIWKAIPQKYRSTGGAPKKA